MSDLEEAEFLERITEGTGDDWADFWASQDPTEVLMNDNKMEEINADLRG